MSFILQFLALPALGLYGYLAYMQMEHIYDSSRNISHLMPLIFVLIHISFAKSGVTNYGLYVKLVGMKMTMKEVSAEFQEGRHLNYKKSNQYTA